MTLNTVTFTLTLPEGGMFRDQIDGLRAARDTQHKLGNPGAAQSLTMLLALAERGLLAYDTDKAEPVVGDASGSYMGSGSAFWNPDLAGR